MTRSTSKKVSFEGNFEENEVNAIFDGKRKLEETTYFDRIWSKM